MQRVLWPLNHFPVSASLKLSSDALVLALLPTQQSGLGRLEPGASLIHARMRAGLAGLDEGTFTEGDELPDKWRVSQQVIGRRLSQEEAKRLLTKVR
jgi:hypothetical protein